MTARTAAAPEHGEADLLHPTTHGAAVTIERVAGIMLTAFGLVYLVLLVDVALGAFFAGAYLTRALVMRILVLGAVFMSAVLFGVLFSRPGGQAPNLPRADATAEGAQGP